MKGQLLSHVAAAAIGLAVGVFGTLVTVIYMDSLTVRQSQLEDDVEALASEPRESNERREELNDTNKEPQGQAAAIPSHIVSDNESGAFKDVLRLDIPIRYFGRDMTSIDYHNDDPPFGTVLQMQNWTAEDLCKAVPDIQEVRIAPDQRIDRFTVFAPEIVRLKGGGYRMYYAGYRDPKRACVLTAVSRDGLQWQKASEPVLAPGSTAWDAAKCSEMCIIWNPQASVALDDFRMFYEACDGTAEGQRGVWRIARAACVC